MENLPKQGEDEPLSEARPEIATENNPWELKESSEKIEEAEQLREALADLQDRLDSLDEVHAEYIRKKWARKIGRLLLISGVATAILGSGNETASIAARFLTFFSFPVNGYGGIIGPRPFQYAGSPEAEKVRIEKQTAEALAEFEELAHSIRDDIDAQLISGGAAYETIEDASGDTHDELRATPEQIAKAHEEMEKAQDA
jgi:hypothetical protein